MIKLLIKEKIIWKMWAAFADTERDEKYVFVVLENKLTK